MKLKILETYNATNSFMSINNSDRVAAYWFDNKKVGNVTLNDYMRYEKGQDATLEYMSPNEYLNRCVDIFGSTYIKSITPIEKYHNDIITKYANDMLNGDKFPIPYLDYVNNQQEGRHRALAVQQAFGKDSIIPVIVIRPTDPTEEELRYYAEQRWPEDPEWGFEYVKQKFEKFDNVYNTDIDNDIIEIEDNSDTDFNLDIDSELEDLYNNIDEEDFLNFVNQMYSSNYNNLGEVNTTKFTRALDKYLDLI